MIVLILNVLPCDIPAMMKKDGKPKTCTLEESRMKTNLMFAAGASLVAIGGAIHAGCSEHQTGKDGSIVSALGIVGMAVGAGIMGYAVSEIKFQEQSVHQCNASTQYSESKV